MSQNRTFTNQDITDYYDHTEVHYRRFWKFEESMGLHYGVWDETTRNLAEAIKNTNLQLAKMGQITAQDYVLDAGCGVGGSSILLAQNIGCQAVGITLSERQVKTATGFAEKKGVANLVRFEKMDYTKTTFPDHTFDVVWAIESMQTATDKSFFFKEMKRLLKPGGRLLMADVFKEGNWKIENTPVMQDMLHGWAISDILTMKEITGIMNDHSFNLAHDRNVMKEIMPSIQRIYWAGCLGMVGTKVYNFFYDASPFSKIHYKTGLAQYKAWKKGLWSYRLIMARINEN